MLMKISLVIALCSGTTFSTVQKQVAEIQRQHPNTQVSVRVDKKAACYQGMVLTGKDAKLLQTLGK